MPRMCKIASERVRAMCAYFERVDQAVDFAVAVGQLFKSVSIILNSFNCFFFIKGMAYHFYFKFTDLSAAFWNCTVRSFPRTH